MTTAAAHTAMANRPTARSTPRTYRLPRRRRGDGCPRVNRPCISRWSCSISAWVSAAAPSSRCSPFIPRCRCPKRLSRPPGSGRFSSSAATHKPSPRRSTGTTSPPYVYTAVQRNCAAGPPRPSWFDQAGRGPRCDHCCDRWPCVLSMVTRRWPSLPHVVGVDKDGAGEAARATGGRLGRVRGSVAARVTAARAGSAADGRSAPRRLATVPSAARSRRGVRSFVA